MVPVAIDPGICVHVCGLRSRTKKKVLVYVSADSTPLLTGGERRGEEGRGVGSRLASKSEGMGKKIAITERRP